MGCAQSKIDNEESVLRCKERKNLMKEAVCLRNAFASAHSGYSMSLKDTGAALSDYAEGEVLPRLPEAAVAPPVQTPVEKPQPPPTPRMESSIKPPPPLPDFSPAKPLQHAATMPAELVNMGKIEGIDENDISEEDEKQDLIPRRKKGIKEVDPKTKVSTPDQTTPPDIKGMAWDFFYTDHVIRPSLDEVEEQEGFVEERIRNLDMNFNNLGQNVEFKTPEKRAEITGVEEFKTPEETPVSVHTDKQFMHSNTSPYAADGSSMHGAKIVGNGNGVDLLKILSEIDDHFLKASQSSQEVSKMLEATRLHYHSNFADNRGNIDHAARLMHVITWNKNFRGVPDSDGSNNNLDAGDFESHATVLDKLLAWEKKLYEGVKAGELMKVEYRGKVATLNKLKKRKASPERLEKAKAAVSDLHTRYIVDMQSLDSTVSEVNDIRDMELYPKLVALVHGMTKMWESMCTHHESQLKIVKGLKSLCISGPMIETTKHHHERTKQLFAVVQKWLSYFDKLVNHQKQYIQTLNGWLKLNLIPVESSLKEKVSSPPRRTNPPIQQLLQSWNELLEKLPDEVAKSAITSFSAVIKTIIVHQEEEMKAKEKFEETRKEYLRKNTAYEEWHQKYIQRRTLTDDQVIENDVKNLDSEKQFVVESLKKRLDEEMEQHRKHCIHVREKSLGNLKIRLPEVFRALSDYAHSCFDGYETLLLLTNSRSM